MITRYLAVFVAAMALLVPVSAAGQSATPWGARTCRADGATRP